MAKSSEGYQSDNEVEGKTSLSSQHAQVQPLTLTPKLPSPQSIRVDSPKHSSTHVDVEEAQPDSAVEFRLYKRRFAGVVGLFLLNLAGGMAYPWFGPIANETADTFHISLTRVNWLSNVLGLVYLPIALLTPSFTARYGLRRSCEIGSFFLLISSWVRYAGTIKSLSTESAYALLLIGQFLAGVAQPIFQVLGPVYSELWFDTRGRTTATMILTISNQIGAAVGQIVSPAAGDPRTAVLALGIIATAVSPFCFVVGSRPPTPPTYAGSVQSPPMMAFLRAWFGMRCPPESSMSVRERIDFTLIAFVFTILVGATSTFSILTNQYFQPYGYDADTSGYFGAVLLLVGLLAAIITAPLFDRVLTHHLSLCIKICCPVIGAAWFSLIWAARPNNTGALFALFAIIGACTLPLLPVGLELAVEVTRNADASSALLFFAGNAFGVISLAIEDALRLGEDASPPQSMKHALIFQGAVVLVACVVAFGIRGNQARRERDERAQAGMDTQGRGGQVPMREVDSDRAS